MKKLFGFLLIGMFLILSLGAVSAKTVVAGKIYNADYTDTISGADVVVDCNGEITNTISRSDGSYNAEYTEHDCDDGDSLTVSATKGDLFGSQTGVIHNDALSNNWDLAVVNVPLVPEFGFIAGMATILGAVGLFFYVRKK